MVGCQVVPYLGIRKELYGWKIPIQSGALTAQITSAMKIPYD